MNPIYHAYHPKYQLTVEQTGPGEYLLFYEPYADWTGRTALHAFDSKEAAAAAAKRFPEFLQMAELRGYALKGPFLVRSSGKSVHVSFALEPAMTVHRFRELLGTDPEE